MRIDHPYYRIARPIFGSQGRSFECFIDKKVAPDAIDLIRAGKLLENDLLRNFEYVEPRDSNVPTCSHQLYQLLLRACTEVEACCSAILAANGYPGQRDSWTVKDYCKVEKATRLSEYEVLIPVWQGASHCRQPFKGWATGHTLGWYQSYNKVKHDRAANFEEANLGNVLDAVTGVFALLFAQFNICAFDPYRPISFTFDGDDGSIANTHSIFQIRQPKWADSEQYDFNWDVIKNEAAPFQTIVF